VLWTPHLQQDVFSRSGRVVSAGVQTQCCDNIHCRSEFDGDLVLVLCNEEPCVRREYGFSGSGSLCSLDPTGGCNPRSSDRLEIALTPLLPLAIRAVGKSRDATKLSRALHIVIVAAAILSVAALFVTVWAPAAFSI